MLLHLLLVSAAVAGAASQHTTVFHMPPGATNATFVVDATNTTNVTYLVQRGSDAVAQVALPSAPYLAAAGSDCLLSSCDENDIACDSGLPLCGPVCPAEACSRVNCSSCWQADFNGPCCWSCCLPPFSQDVYCPTEPCFPFWPYPANSTADIQFPSLPIQKPQTLPVQQAQPLPVQYPQPLPYPRPQPFPLPVYQPQPQPFPLPVYQPQPQPVPMPFPQPQPVPMPYPQPQPVVFPQPIPVPQPRPVPIPVPQPQPVVFPQPRPVPYPYPYPYPQPVPVPRPVPYPQPLPVTYPQGACYGVSTWPFLRCPPQQPQTPACYPWMQGNCGVPQQPPRLCYNLIPC